MFMTSGCQKEIQNNYICPSFPQPTKNTLLKLKEVNNNEINDWVKDLYLYSKKVEIINNKEENGKFKQ